MQIYLTLFNESIQNKLNFFFRSYTKIYKIMVSDTKIENILKYTKLWY